MGSSKYIRLIENVMEDIDTHESESTDNSTTFTIPLDNNKILEVTFNIKESFKDEDSEDLLKQAGNFGKLMGYNSSAMVDAEARKKAGILGVGANQANRNYTQAKKNMEEGDKVTSAVLNKLQQYLAKIKTDINSIKV